VDLLSWKFISKRNLLELWGFTQTWLRMKRTNKYHVNTIMNDLSRSWTEYRD